MAAKEKVKDHASYNGNGFLEKISRMIKKRENKK
jgi:hypothetical protein